MTAAKLFTHGGSQAVRLPKEFRFDGHEVQVRRVGGEVVLSASPLPSADALIEAILAFESGVVIQREQPTGDQIRTAIRPIP